MKNETVIKTRTSQSAAEKACRAKLQRHFRECPIPNDEILQNLSLFISRPNLSQILFVNELYRHILDVHGVIIEFGIRWGRNLATYIGLRGIYEPHNHNRTIVGFDTFTGFPKVTPEDGSVNAGAEGSYTTTNDYSNYLPKVLARLEEECPISHITKFKIIPGDASLTLPKYLAANPQTIIALAYFDFDLYEPTKQCLETIKPHLVKGSILGFDQANHPQFPGETLAIKSVFPLNSIRLKHSIFSPTQSYAVVE